MSIPRALLVMAVATVRDMKQRALPETKKKLRHAQASDWLKQSLPIFEKRVADIEVEIAMWERLANGEDLL